MSLRKFFTGLAVILTAGAVPINIAGAQETGELAIELNKVEPSQSNCVLTFLVSSKIDQNIDSLAFEFVIFDSHFKVDRMTVFDFRKIEAKKSRVRQFQLPDTSCENLSRILINDVSACSGEGLAPEICSAALKTTNKTKLEFLN